MTMLSKINHSTYVVPPNWLWVKNEKKNIKWIFIVYFYWFSQSNLFRSFSESLKENNYFDYVAKINHSGMVLIDLVKNQLTSVIFKEFESGHTSRRFELSALRHSGMSSKPSHSLSIFLSVSYLCISFKAWYTSLVIFANRVSNIWLNYITNWVFGRRPQGRTKFVLSYRLARLKAFPFVILSAAYAELHVSCLSYSTTVLCGTASLPV